jgi:hypothetical protein
MDSPCQGANRANDSGRFFSRLIQLGLDALAVMFLLVAFVYVTRGLITGFDPYCVAALTAAAITCAVLSRLDRVIDRIRTIPLPFLGPVDLNPPTATPSTTPPTSGGGRKLHGTMSARAKPTKALNPPRKRASRCQVPLPEDSPLEEIIAYDSSSSENA